MRILVLSFFYEPDLSAGSFRNTSLVTAIKNKLNKTDQIDVITTFPNRYHSYKTETKQQEIFENLSITRITLSEHKNGFFDQIFSFQEYFWKVLKHVRKNKYDIVYASSSKLFTAFLGALIARKKKIPLYLDIRDIFVDTITDVITSKLLKWILLPFLRRIEQFTYRNASHINLVSEGFRNYYENIYNGPITYFSNGIDEEFIQPCSQDETINIPLVITYAGNIGEGQGLEKIIPEAAYKLGNNYLFKVIGDGGTKQKLVKRIKDMGVNNVEIIPPVSRNELLKYYTASDFLFLHLNNYKAFEKVLPSKIFEYGALRKRIIAGVSGYPRVFIENNLPDAILFDPGNVNDFLRKMDSALNKNIEREVFIKKFRRINIIDRLADSILMVAHSHRTSSDYFVVPEHTGTENQIS